MKAFMTVVFIAALLVHVLFVQIPKNYGVLAVINGLVGLCSAGVLFSYRKAKG